MKNNEFFCSEKDSHVGENIWFFSPVQLNIMDLIFRVLVRLAIHFDPTIV